MKKIFVICITLSVAFLSCTMDQAPPPPADTGFPPEISAIINNKCSITGCHTSQAKIASGGLAMETWDQLFEGGRGGAVAIAYRPDQSWITYYTNTDTSKGVVLTPTMPYNLPPLSDEEWQTIYDWLLAGAPNDDGVIPFSGDTERRKFYISNQGCDLVSVFDAETKLCMRIITVGESSGSVEVPHQIKVSPDGKYWYAIFLDGTVIQKFNAEDDSFIREIPLGGGAFSPVGYWNTMAITSDGKYAFAVDWTDIGKVSVVDLENMTFVTQYLGLNWPHGSWVNEDGTVLYVTSQYGNYIYKLDVSTITAPSFDQITMNGQTPNNFQGTFDPHEVNLSPDESKYFVTCQASDEVRVFDANTDTLIAVIGVGDYPLEMAFSNSHPYMFVTCQDDPCAEDKCLGSVYIIDYNTLQVVKVLQDELYQPHGIGVIDELGYAVVASRNLDLDGPAPHHVSDCGGRNGFIKLIDLNTLEFISEYKTEVSVDPYSLTVR